MQLGFCVFLVVIFVVIVPPIRCRLRNSFDDDPFQDDLEDLFGGSRVRNNNNEEEGDLEEQDNDDDGPTVWVDDQAQQDDADSNSQEDGNDQMIKGEDETESWQADPNILSLYPKLGQVVAVALNKSDKNLIVFHRGSAVWNEETFSENGTFQKASAGPIRDSTILFYNTKSNTLVKKAGKNMFYMPHGMSIGADGSSIWVTDVALHQVFRLVQTQSPPFVKPDLILGEAFQPGSDDRHFCKPTAVVQATSDGSVFVADGYCNGRIMKFNGKTGALVSKFGTPTPPSPDYVTSSPEIGTFFIPHSLTLIEERDLICVADRENRRVQCFSAGLRNNDETGRFIAEISHSEFGEIYAIKYAKKSNLLLALSRDSLADATYPNRIFAIDATTGKPFEAISVPGLVNGHDLDVDDEQGPLVMYVAETGPPNRIWRLIRSG